MARGVMLLRTVNIKLLWEGTPNSQKQKKSDNRTPIVIFQQIVEEQTVPDDRIYDAINLFKYSPTGQGKSGIGGDAAYRARYKQLAVDVVEKLWLFWSADEIGFANLPHNSLANAEVGRPGYDIKVNNLLEPSPDPAVYATAAEQGKLAVTSCNLVHEATHLVSKIACYPEEEVLCRTIEVLYFQDLKQGRRYRSRVTGNQLVAKFDAAVPYYNNYKGRLRRFQSHDLIDNVFSIVSYRRDLEELHTADFITRSLGWWRGLRHRWPSTRGYYLRSLASQNCSYAEQILQILESLTTSQWPAARSCAGDLEKIRESLRSWYHILYCDFDNRIQQVQQNLGTNFGIQPCARGPVNGQNGQHATQNLSPHAGRRSSRLLYRTRFNL